MTSSDLAPRPKSVSRYSEVEAFTEDERYVLFSSDRSGTWLLYRTEVESGELAQLTNVECFNTISFTVARDGTSALFTAGRRVYCVEVERAKTPWWRTARGWCRTPCGIRLSPNQAMASSLRFLPRTGRRSGDCLRVCRFQ